MATGPEDIINNDKLFRGLELISVKDFDAADRELHEGLFEAEAFKDPGILALFHSSLGIMYRLKKDFKQSWKHYEKAERLLPEDPAFKIISAKLLVDIFGQYDSAIRRCKKVFTLPSHDPIFHHQAYTTMGLAYLKKGNKEEAIQCLVDAMQDNFDKLESAGNIDVQLLKELMKKKCAAKECRAYLQSASYLAKKRKENELTAFFSKLASRFGPL